MTDDDALADYVTDGQAAQLLHVTTATLRAWRYQGVGPKYAKAGRRPLYRKSELTRWLAESERQGTAVA